MEKTNAGYNIILTYKVTATTWIVYACHPMTGTHVTWEYNEFGKFYWGHYFQYQTNALKDYIKRIENFERIKKEIEENEKD